MVNNKQDAGRFLEKQATNPRALLTSAPQCCTKLPTRRKVEKADAAKSDQSRARKEAVGVRSCRRQQTGHPRRPRGADATGVFRQRLVPFCAAFFVCLLPAVAFAAEGDSVDRISFFTILYDGAEWPGVLIGLLSLASVTIIVEHFWTIRRNAMVPDDEVESTRALIEARKFNQCLDQIRTSRTMFADVLTAALRHGKHGFEAMHEAADERASAWSTRLFRRVEYLHIIGNLAPLLGLLGTVLGMIEAFGAMQALHGAYKPEHLAGGISLALVNTFLGLAVAILALGFFGICRNRVDSLTVAAHAEVIDILEYFRPSPPSASAPNREKA